MKRTLEERILNVLKKRASTAGGLAAALKVRKLTVYRALARMPLLVRASGYAEEKRRGPKAAVYKVFEQ